MVVNNSAAGEDDAPVAMETDDTKGAKVEVLVFDDGVVEIPLTDTEPSEPCECKRSFIRLALSGLVFSSVRVHCQRNQLVSCRKRKC